MNFVSRHIKFILFVAVASLLITQQELASHDHGILIGDCVICKMVDHNSGFVPVTKSFAALYIVISFISIEFSRVLLRRKNWITPALRAPPQPFK